MEHISFKALGDEHMGIAMWQADGSGPEPAAVGHSLDTPLGRITSHFYIASREYGGIDPASPGGFRGMAPVRGFKGVNTALAEHGLDVDRLILNMPLTTPGGDREGVDWFFEDGVEQRNLRPSTPFELLLDTVVIAHLPAELLLLTEDYTGAQSMLDLRITVVSDSFRVGARPSEIRDAAAEAVSRAFYRDVGNRALRLVVDAILFRREQFSGNGRVHGGFADLPRSRIEIV